MATYLIKFVQALDKFLILQIQIFCVGTLDRNTLGMHGLTKKAECLIAKKKCISKAKYNKKKAKCLLAKNKITKSTKKIEAIL